jgi:hypothetical protein
MKQKKYIFAAAMLVLAVASLMAQPKRPDAIWGRQVNAGAITVDGVLNEGAWAKAESLTIKFGTNLAGDPGSGYIRENGIDTAKDPIDATVKFIIAKNNKMYVAIYARDKSVGGGTWAQFDALLMNLRDKKNKDANTGIASPYEFFYGWVAEGWADPTLNVGQKAPGFFGWANGHRDSICTNADHGDNGVLNKDIWNGATKVLGRANDDSSANSIDTAWVTELEFDLGRRGYDATKVGGEVVMFSFAIFDADYRWPIDTTKVHGQRAWLQGPWGNASAYSHLRVFTDATIDMNATLPAMPYDVTIYDGKNYADPTIDGKLNESVWASTPGFNIKFGDNALRATYKNSIPHRSGQFQPAIYGVKADVLNPADATMKMFFKNDTLYVGIDVRDQIVQYRPEFDRQDGFRFMPKSRTERDGAEKFLISREIFIRVDTSAKKYSLEGFGPELVADTNANKGSKIMLGLNTGTTVDTLGASADAGYQIDYGAGRSDGLFWFGGMLLDGDTFGSSLPPYGNRVWFGQEGTWNDGPALAYMDPAMVVSVGRQDNGVTPGSFELYGAYPNPFNPSTTIEFSLPVASNVKVTVFDMLGRAVSEKIIFGLAAGRQGYQFNASSLASGAYIYRVQMLGAGANDVLSSKVGKFVLMK